MSTGPRPTVPQLASGERLVSLEEAARLLRVSKTTLQARMDHDRDPGRSDAQRYLTAGQIDPLAKEFARRRAGGALSLDEAARFLEMPEEEVLRLVESGELREADPRSAFFTKKQVELLFVRRQGIDDAVSIADVLRGSLVDDATAREWVRTGRLKGARVGRSTFVSRREFESFLKSRDRALQRLRVLEDAGRFVSRADAARRLNVGLSALHVLEIRGLLKPFRVKRLSRVFYPRRALESYERAKEERRNPPSNTLSLAQVRKKLGVCMTVVYKLIHNGHLHVVAQRKTGRVVVKGYDPMEVERLRAELDRTDKLVSTARAAKMLGTPGSTIRRLAREGLLVVQPGVAGISSGLLFEPKEVEALKDDPLTARRIARARAYSRPLGNTTWPLPAREETSELPLASEAGGIGLGRVVTLATAARMLGRTVQEVRHHIALGELRVRREGQGVDKADLGRLLAKGRSGFGDALLLSEAMRLFPQASLRVKAGLLRSTRVRCWVFVSCSDVEAMARREEKHNLRLRLLQRAGRIMLLTEAANFLGVGTAVVRKLLASGSLKRFGPKRPSAVFIRRQDLERAKALGLSNQRAPPPGLLSASEVSQRFGLSKGFVRRVIAQGILRKVETSNGVPGFDPKEVEQIKAREERMATLVTSLDAARILGLGPSQVRYLAERGVLVPEAYDGRKLMFDPEALMAVQDHPEIAVAKVHRARKKRGAGQ